jgi:MFS family permease
MTEAASAPVARSGALAALAPLSSSYGFRIILTAQLIGILGRWMQSLSAQWSLVHTSPALVALVPTAMSVPVVLFALIAGAWADMVDRRRMLILTQAALALTAGSMAMLWFAGFDSAWIVLSLMFMIGTWTAANIPPFQSAASEIVPKEHVVQAATLTAVGANVGRAIGPALAGAVVMAAGIGGGFALAAATYALAWAYTVRVGPLGHQRRSTERFGEAIRAGNRFVRHSTSTQHVLLLTVVFVALNSAAWALLPSYAEGRLGLGASGYGFLLGAVGAGALLGALLMPGLMISWSRNRLFAVGVVLAAAATVGVTFVGDAWMAGLLLVPFGVGYIIVIALTNGTLQLTLPLWVRARGLAFYLVAFHIALAGGSAAWGLAADSVGVRKSIAISGLLLLAVVPMFRWVKVPEGIAEDPADVAGSPEPQLLLDVATEEIPVTVTTVYHVAAEHQAEFVRTMAGVGKARTRAGAYRYELLQDGSSPDAFIEKYLAPSWAGFVRQQAERLSPADRELERRAHELAYQVGTERHWFPPRPSADRACGAE